MRIRNVRLRGGDTVDVLSGRAKIAVLWAHDPTLPVAPGGFNSRDRILIPKLSEVHAHLDSSGLGHSFTHALSGRAW